MEVLAIGTINPLLEEISSINIYVFFFHNYIRNTHTSIINNNFMFFDVHRSNQKEYIANREEHHPTIYRYIAWTITTHEVWVIEIGTE